MRSVGVPALTPKHWRRLSIADVQRRSQRCALFLPTSPPLSYFHQRILCTNMTVDVFCWGDAVPTSLCRRAV